MTPEREPGRPDVGPRGATPPASGETAGDPTGAAVPRPRPEVLARVLDGLRDLPAARRPPHPGDTDGDTGPGPTLPLPRRR